MGEAPDDLAEGLPAYPDGIGGYQQMVVYGYAPRRGNGFPASCMIEVAFVSRMGRPIGQVRRSSPSLGAQRIGVRRPHRRRMVFRLKRQVDVQHSTADEHQDGAKDRLSCEGANAFPS